MNQTTWLGLAEAGLLMSRMQQKHAHAHEFCYLTGLMQLDIAIAMLMMEALGVDQ